MSYIAAHLLITDADTEPSDVRTLIGNVRPRAQHDPDTGLLRLSRHSLLEGPLDLDANDRRELGTQEGAVVFALWGPTDREPKRPSGDGPLDEFFPHGLPEREEERNVDLLLALARRLHGSVRFAGEGAARTLTPDPDQHALFTVYSSYWLDPQLCAHTVAEIIDDVQAYDQFTLNQDFISADEPIVLDGYSVTATLAAGPDYPAEVSVLVEHTLPEAVAQYALAPLIAYQVRWIAPDTVGEDPARVDPATRAHTIVELEHITAHLIRATAGIGVDADGFLVVESQLAV